MTPAANHLPVRWSLSTSFRSTDLEDADALMALLEPLDIDAVELEYRIPEILFHRLRPALQAARLPVGSIHNFFPHPADRPKLSPSGDLFSLSSIDADIRRLAVAYTRRTIEIANAMETPLVVLHCGAVEMETGYDRLRPQVDDALIDADGIRDMLALKLAERDRLKPPYLEQLKFSLDRLLKTAERQQVRLGLENRYHYHELPTFADFGELFDLFDGAPLGYWHDTGHAHAHDCLGLGGQSALLDAYGKRLVGIHLHDARRMDDHLPPGTGEIDFSAVWPHLVPGMPAVVELKPGTPVTAAAEGIDYLRGSLRSTAPWS